MNDVRDGSLGALLERAAVAIEAEPADRLPEVLHHGSRLRAARLTAIGTAIAVFVGALSWAGLSLPRDDAAIPANVAHWRTFASLDEDGWTVQVPPEWHVQSRGPCTGAHVQIVGAIVTNVDFGFRNPDGHPVGCWEPIVWAGFPPDGVAFAIQADPAVLLTNRKPPTLFPLTPDALMETGAVRGGPSESYVSVKIPGEAYPVADVRRWVGPEASADDVASLDRLLASLQVRGASRWIETEGTMNILHDELRHYSVRYPEEWTVAAENLTPWLVSPEEILSIGTFPLPVSEDPEQGLRFWDAPVAPAALADMTAEDALLSVQESGNVDPDFFESRPADFGPLGCDEAIFHCGAETWHDVPFLAWWIPFRDEGRSFYLFVAIGNEVTSELREEAWAVADGLAFEP